MLGLLLPSGGEPGGVPDRPEHVLRGGPVCGLPGRHVEQRRHPAGRRGHAVPDRVQGTRVGERLAQRSAVECPPEPAQAEAVGLAERAGQQLGGGLLVEPLRADGAAQQREQRPDARLVRQGQLVAGDGDRYARGGQRPAQRRYLPPRRADKHRHPPPRHPVRQVRPAQGVRDHRGLLRPGIRDADPDLAGRAAWHRPELAVQRGAAARRGRQPPGNPARRGEQHRSAATAGAQRDDRSGRAVRAAELIGEAGQHTHVRAAEGVDRLVGVAHGYQVPAVAGQRLQQGLLRRVAVLVLVDEHGVVRVPLPLPGGLPGEQPRRDPDDLRVVIRGHRGQVEARGVAVEEPARRHPVVAPAAPAELAQRLTVEPALGGAHQDVAQLLGEPPGGERGPEPAGQFPAPSATSPRSIRRISRSCSGAESRRGGWSPASTNSRRASA